MDDEYFGGLDCLPLDYDYRYSVLQMMPLEKGQSGTRWADASTMIVTPEAYFMLFFKIIPIVGHLFRTSFLFSFPCCFTYKK